MIVGGKIDRFLDSYDMSALYQDYAWGEDNWASGFKCIVVLEKRFKKARERNCLTYDDIKKVLEWGRARAKNSMRFPQSLYISKNEINNPNLLFRRLQSEKDKKNISGIGPTYQSKIIRFICPENAGCIDTRLVQTFGLDSAHAWIDLQIRDYGFGPYIPESKRKWSQEYMDWLDVLVYIRNKLIAEGKHCPHPYTLTESRLRIPGKWACADVEMALFQYASRQIKNE